MKSALAIICVFLAIYSVSSKQHLNDPMMELSARESLQELFEGQYQYWNITLSEDLSKCFTDPSKTLNLIQKYFEKLNSMSNVFQLVAFVNKDYVDSITTSKKEKECYVKAPENIELAQKLDYEQFSGIFKKASILATLVIKLPYLQLSTTSVVQCMENKEYSRAGYYISRSAKVFYK